MAISAGAGLCDRSVGGMRGVNHGGSEIVSRRCDEIALIRPIAKRTKYLGISFLITGWGDRTFGQGVSQRFGKVRFVRHIAGGAVFKNMTVCVASRGDG